MYPLNVSLPAPKIGFAVANDADEHASLTAAGYLPALEKAPPAPDPIANDEATELDAVRDKLDDLGIAYHHRAGLEKLKALLPAA